MSRVVVLGASANPERYSNKAIQRLLNAGEEVLPVHPALDSINGVKVYRSIADVPAPVDSVTVYVNGLRLQSMVEDLIQMNPRRVVLNPGAESSEASARLKAAGIDVLQACTLVMLSTGQW